MSGLKKEIRTRTRLKFEKEPTAFTPYFDFDDYAIAEAPRVDPTQVVMEACQAWVDRGNQIARGDFGVKSVGFYRDERGDLHATYEAMGEICCPFGVLLDGRESHFMIVADVVKLLGTDEFWGVGFIHGFDKENITTIGRNLDRFLGNANYIAGRAAGQQTAARFVKEE